MNKIKILTTAVFLLASGFLTGTLQAVQDLSADWQTHQVGNYSLKVPNNLTVNSLMWTNLISSEDDSQGTLLIFRETQLAEDEQNTEEFYANFVQKEMEVHRYMRELEDVSQLLGRPAYLLTHYGAAGETLSSPAYDESLKFQNDEVPQNNREIEQLSLILLVKFDGGYWRVWGNFPISPIYAAPEILSGFRQKKKDSALNLISEYIKPYQWDASDPSLLQTDRYKTRYGSFDNGPYLSNLRSVTTFSNVAERKGKNIEVLTVSLNGRTPYFQFPLDEENPYIQLKPYTAAGLNGTEVLEYRPGFRAGIYILNFFWASREKSGRQKDSDWLKEAATKALEVNYRVLPNRHSWHPVYIYEILDYYSTWRNIINSAVKLN